MMKFVKFVKVCCSMLKLFSSVLYKGGISVLQGETVRTVKVGTLNGKNNLTKALQVV